MTKEVLNDIDAEEIVDRKNLAVILRVKDLKPIPGKDRIEFLYSEGWVAVVEKGRFQIGDLVIVIRYDSVVPEAPVFEWMRSFKFRVKTKTFNTDEGKVYSQVICITFDEFKKHLDESTSFWDDLEAAGYEGSQIIWKEGTDVTDYIGVKKYIPPPAKGGGTSFGTMQPKGDFPSHLISKTDETNVQSKVAVLDEMKDMPYYLTMKCDGSSLTALHVEDEFCVCSRNHMIKEAEDNSFWQVANKYKLREILAENKNLAIQGELCGPKIQGNKMGLKENDLFIFNIIDLETRQRINFDDIMEFCDKHGLKMVPIVAYGSHFSDDLAHLLKISTVYKYHGTENGIEGLVLRPCKATHSKVLKGDMSVKIMNPEYK